MHASGVDPVAAWRTLREMVAIPSPTGHESGLAGYLAGRMSRLGLRTWIDSAGNVLGAAGRAAGPTVMLLGHLDTVRPVLPVYEEGGRLFGRGTVDAKGALAAMAHAVAALPTSVPARFLVVGAVDEEGGSAGAVHLRDSVPPPDAVLIGEPSGADSVVVGYKGVLRILYTVDRPAGHSSRPEPSAAELAARWWSELAAHLAGLGGRTQFDRALPSLVAMEGDATHARAEVSCRLPLGFDVDGWLAWLAGPTGPTAGGAITVLERVPAVRAPRSGPVVTELTAAVREVLGSARTKVKLGTSDMNVVVPTWAVPAAAYGPGDAHLDHTDDEHLDRDEYLASIEVLTLALPRIAAELAGAPGGRGARPAPVPALMREG